MPREITKHRTILEAVRSVSILSELLNEQGGHFEHELDLEVIAYGRNYNGKKVGPYVRLLVYDAGEEVVREDDWGGNTFYVSVEGALDVFVRGAEGEARVGQIQPGTSFGEMSVLAGVPRNATVRVPAPASATVLEITRPALRLLRKLPRFGKQLDIAYRRHGLGRALAEVRQVTGGTFDGALLERLGKSARFMVYGKHHLLFREGEAIDRIFFVRDGWVRRVTGIAYTPAMGDLIVGGIHGDVAVDFLGAGNCLGLEGLARDARWGYTATVLQRTEVLELSVAHLRADQGLRETVERAFAEFSRADDETRPSPPADAAALAAAEKEIATGVVDGTNLLVMDMDLCVRCGNCSMACHQIHGRSRLLRRGIHIERPVVQLGRTKTQHVLSPSVCMHCENPECLTGCPTGAIGRFEGGQIDIDPKTCIGCADCATQCPYNAISMIPRRAAAPEAAGLAGRLRGLFSLAAPREPEPVTETENLLATKCNLCNNTPLNPKGAKTHKYSCEENCPTGALVRVNPREYFDEAKERIGLVYQDRTHAVGRNIHRRDALARLWHVFGVLSTAAVSFAFVRLLLKYGIDERLWETWLTVRWLTGLVGLVGVAAVMTYPLRKQVYRRRAGALRYWLLAHVYLGVLGGIVLLLHGGRSTGGLLTTLLMLSFDAVILTGLFGLACYVLLPRVMTSIEGEPLLVEDLRSRREELREKLAGVGAEAGPELRRLIKRKVLGKYLSLGFLLRQYVRREELVTLLARARGEFEGEVRPEAQRRLLLEAAETAVTLRRIDALVYAHQLLKLWLAPHVVTTALMLALMLVHVIQVVFFAVR